MHKYLKCLPQEQKTKYWELQQESLDRQKHLSGLNDDLRQGLANLEARVENIALANTPTAEGGEILTPDVAPSNDAAVVVAAAAAASASSVGGEDHAAISEELRALKRKVSIIAANVLGEAEGESMDVATEPQVIKLLHSKDDDDDDNDTCRANAGIAGDTTSADCEKNTSEGHYHTDARETMTDTGGDLRQQQGGDGSGNPRMLPRRVKARRNWVKVRMHRAFLVKKIRRQVSAFNNKYEVHEAFYATTH